MADAAARREARRRKIIQNSHNRLEKICGKQLDSGEIDAPDISYKENIPESKPVNYSNNVMTECNNGEISHSQFLQETFDELSHHEDFRNQLGFSDNESLISESNNLKNWQWLATTKYDIVMLAFVVQILSTSFLKQYFANIIAPLIVYDITKVLLLPPKPINALARIILYHIFPPVLLNQLLPSARVIALIITDLSLYVFSTVLFQVFLTISSRPPDD